MADLSYPAAAALTLGVELPVYVVVLTRWGGASAVRAAAIGVVVNVASHPTLWFLLVPGVRALTGSHEIGVAVAEAVVWWGEGIAAALLLPRLDPDEHLGPRRLRTGVAASFLANAASFALGLILTAA